MILLRGECVYAVVRVGPEESSVPHILSVHSTEVGAEERRTVEQGKCKKHQYCVIKRWEVQP